MFFNFAQLNVAKPHAIETSKCAYWLNVTRFRQRHLINKKSFFCRVISHFSASG